MWTLLGLALFGFLGERLVTTYDRYLQSRQMSLIPAKVRVRTGRKR
jgi:predicted membrane chloride channel (bestrophin family)